MKKYFFKVKNINFNQIKFLEMITTTNIKANYPFSCLRNIKLNK